MLVQSNISHITRLIQVCKTLL